MLRFFEKVSPKVFVSKNERIVFEEGNTTLVLVNIQDIESTQWRNWKNNRPPDAVRVAQIRQYFESCNIRLVPGIVYAWEKDTEFLVYDGIHRLQAAFHSHLSPELKVLVRVIRTDREQDVIDDFLNINKSVSVPCVYLEHDNHCKRTVCQSLADELCSRYPAFVSASRNHWEYNFNRDKMVDFFSMLQIDFSKPAVDKIILLELTGLNDRAREYVDRNKITLPNKNKKCKFHNVYLFVLFHREPALVRTLLEEAVKGF